jgi:hypothetical protein
LTATQEESKEVASREHTEEIPNNQVSSNLLRLYKERNPTVVQQQNMASEGQQEKIVPSEVVSNFIQHAMIPPSLDSRPPQAQNESLSRPLAKKSKPVDKCIDYSKLKTTIIADHQGSIIHFDDNTPKIFHVDKDLLLNKNFFYLISSY